MQFVASNKAEEKVDSLIIFIVYVDNKFVLRIY